MLLPLVIIYMTPIHIKTNRKPLYKKENPEAFHIAKVGLEESLCTCTILCLTFSNTYFSYSLFQYPFRARFELISPVFVDILNLKALAIFEL